MKAPLENERTTSAWIRKILRCDNLEHCRRIQHGSLFFRRLGKWSILASVGSTLFVSDCVAAVINELQNVEAATTSFLYRWTIGWFVPAREVDWSLIAVWKLLDTAQFVVFFGLVVLAIRWVYADCVVKGTKWIGFGTCMVFAAVTNLVIYFGLRHYLPV